MAKYYNTKEFKALRSEWDSRLAADGFKDIEKTNVETRAEGRLQPSAPRKSLISMQNAGKLRDFFAKLDGFIARRRKTLPPVDRLMLELWSQGRHIVDIAKECQCNGRTVRRRLARYKKIVLAL